jgi:hypothetical protein
MPGLGTKTAAGALADASSRGEGHWGGRPAMVVPATIRIDSRKAIIALLRSRELFMSDLLVDRSLEGAKARA